MTVQIIGETDLSSVWRVDDELLTLEEVPRERLDHYTPINQWLFAMLGSGGYCYFESKVEAKDTLMEILKDRIAELQVQFNELEQE